MTQERRFIDVWMTLQQCFSEALMTFKWHFNERWCWRFNDTNLLKKVWNMNDTNIRFSTVMWLRIKALQSEECRCSPLLWKCQLWSKLGGLFLVSIYLPSSYLSGPKYKSKMCWDSKGIVSFPNQSKFVLRKLLNEHFRSLKHNYRFAANAHIVKAA